MLKKLKSKVRRRKVKKLLRDHLTEIVIGAAVGLLTDIATDVAHKLLAKKLKKIR